MRVTDVYKEHVPAQGSGGMLLVDPLYQRAMVGESRRRGIPVVFDEVFTGLWRLGTPSAAAQLGVSPDIACYAKLLTGARHTVSLPIVSLCSRKPCRSEPACLPRPASA